MLSAYINDCLKRPVLIHSKELQNFVDMPEDVSSPNPVLHRTILCNSFLRRFSQLSPSRAEATPHPSINTTGRARVLRRSSSQRSSSHVCDDHPRRRAAPAPLNEQPLPRSSRAAAAAVDASRCASPLPPASIVASSGASLPPHGGRRVYRCTVPVLASSARDRYPSLFLSDSRSILVAGT